MCNSIAAILLLVMGVSTALAGAPDSRPAKAPQRPPANKARPTLALQVGHTGGIGAVRFSPNGRILATGSNDRTIRLWEMPGGQLQATLRGHTGWVWSLAFSPDGSLLASGGSDLAVRLWDVRARQPVAGRSVLHGHKLLINSLAFSPDGTLLASASRDGSVRLWDVATGRERAAIQAHEKGVNEAAFSPDGKQVATAGEDGLVRLWSVQGRRLAELHGHTGAVLALAFSRPGGLLATGSADGTARLWDLERGAKLRATLRSHAKGVTNVAIAPGGDRVATASYDGSARLWSARTGQLLRTLAGHTAPVRTLVFSPDGATLATGSDDSTVRLWNARTGAEGEARAVLRGHVGMVVAAFSRDGRLLATGGDDATPRLWDPRDGRLRASLEEQPVLLSVLDYCPGNGTLAVGGHDGTVGLWDGAAGQLRLKIRAHPEAVAALALSPDGKLLATAGEDAVRLWQAASGQAIAELPMREFSKVTRLVFSPDGRTLAIGTAYGVVRLWDTAGGRPAALLPGNNALLSRLAFTPDGAGVVTTTGGAGLPRCWFANGPEYRLTVDSNNSHMGKMSGCIRSLGPSAESYFGVMGHVLPAQLLRGKRIRLSGYLKTETVRSGHAALWLRVDGRGSRTLSLDNMDDRGVKGTTGWTRYECTAAVPHEAIQVAFGFLHSGTGIAWGDDLGIEVVGEPTPAALAALLTEMNLDFEKGEETAAVRVRDVGTGRLKWEIRGSEGSVSTATSPGGEVAAAGDRQHTIRLWNGRTGKLLSEVRSPAPFIPLAVSDDGRRLLTTVFDWGSTAGQARRLWDVATGRPLPLRSRADLAGFPPSVTSAFSIGGAGVSLHDPVDGHVLATMVPVPPADSGAAGETPAPQRGAAAAGDEWFVSTPEGYFDCSANAARLIRWNVDGTLYPAERYLRRFRRPDLVRRALQGERIAAPEMSNEDIPPAARFVGLDEGQPVAGRTLAVTVEAHDERDVKEVELLLDGRPLAVSEAKSITLPAKAIPAEAKGVDRHHRVARRFQFHVSLPAVGDEVRLRAVAYNGSGLGSDPVEVVLRRSGASALTARLYVLSVGVGRYRGAGQGGISNLSFAAADARDVARRFRSEGAPLYERVEVRELCDADATLEGVREGLRWLQRSVRPGQVDTAVVFLSGHGLSRADRYYFATHELDLRDVERSSLSAGELREALGAPLRARRVFLFVDTCHSGGLPGRSEDLSHLLGEGVFLVASSGARDYSYESDRWGHGAFTLALLRTLEKPELEEDGAIRFVDLVASIRREVRRLLKEADRNESEQEICVPLAGRDLGAPLARAVRRE